MTPEDHRITITTGYHMAVKQAYWAFVDYENFGSLDTVNLKQYQRIFVFLGAKQNKINVGDHFPVGFCTVEMLRVKKSSANNVDFHIAYYLGKLSTDADPAVDFHILSNDSGYDDLLAHIRHSGRVCRRIERVVKPTPAPNAKPKNKPALNSDAGIMMSRLKAVANPKRPAKPESLKNYIKSHLQLKNDQVRQERVYRQLITDGVVKEDGEKLKYCL